MSLPNNENDENITPVTLMESVLGIVNENSIEYEKKHPISEPTKYYYLLNIKVIVAAIKNLFPDEASTILHDDDLLAIPLSIQVLEKVLTSVLKTSDDKKGKGTCSKMKSTSYFHVIISSIKYLHEISHEKRPDSDPEIKVSAQTIQFFNKVAKGRKLLVDTLKLTGQFPDTGKADLSFEGYKCLARKALIESRSANQFFISHAFLLLSWNMMVKCSLVSSIHWNDLGWEREYLTISYQTGKKPDQVSRIYANPIDPSICPILALGLKLVCESPPLPAKVFVGTCGHSKFSIWLLSALKDVYEQNSSKFGHPLEDLNSLSIKKGASKYVTESASYSSLYSNETDKLKILSGKILAGLDINSDDFNTLWPRFINMDGLDLREVVPHTVWSSASVSLKKAIPYLIASVIYHSGWLQENLPARHPLFFSPTWTRNYCRRWTNKVVLESSYENIPGDLQEDPQVKNTTLDTLKKIEATQAELSSRLDRMPEEVCSLFMSKLGSLQGFQIKNLPCSNNNSEEVSLKGPDPYLSVIQSLQDSVRSLQDELSYIRNTRVESLPSTSTVTKACSQKNEKDNDTDTDVEGDGSELASDGYKLFTWGGYFHMVPEGFEIPCTTPLSIWRLWIHGDASNRLRPLRFLTGRSLLSNRQRAQFSKAKFVMEFMKAKIDFTYEELGGMESTETDQIFLDVFSQFMSAFPNSHTMNCSTAYGHIKKTIPVIDLDLNSV